MTQPGSSRSDDNLLPARDVEPSESAVPDASRELLEQVVRQTLAGSEAGDEPASVERALRDLARRQRARSQSWETTVVELVEQVLESWFAQNFLPANSRRQMAAEIAEVLMTDPTASARLRRFWERISEVTI